MISRYHLDRKLERIVSMLLNLKDLRHRVRNAASRISRCNTSALMSRRPGRLGRSSCLRRPYWDFLPDAPRSKLYVDPSLPAWLPDLMVRDLRIGKHKLDIRFWRGGEQTAFDVVKGEPRLVERCDIASKAAQLRTATDLAEASPETTNRPHKKGGARTAGRVCHPAPCRPRRPPSRRAGWRLAIAHLKE
jgi:hypothetical protein